MKVATGRVWMKDQVWYVEAYDDRGNLIPRTKKSFGDDRVAAFKYLHTLVKKKPTISKIET